MGLGDVEPQKIQGLPRGMVREANELKVVVVNSHDLEWAEEHAAKLQTERPCSCNQNGTDAKR